MRLAFRDATGDDVEELVALHEEVSGALTARYGAGPWSSRTTARGLAFSMTQGRHRVGTWRGRIVTALRLSTRKPWAIDVSYFTPGLRPLYLTGMAVSVERQRRGLGRAALEDALAVARAWPADAVRLDAWDAPAGAGGFYARCDFSGRGRVVYRGHPLVYFERLLT